MDYEHLRKLAAEATPGPWEAVEIDVYREHWSLEVRPIEAQFSNYRVWGVTDRSIAANAAFIALSREAVPALLDERDRLAAEVVALREALEEYGEHNSGCDADWTRVSCSCGLGPILYADPSPAVAEVERLVALGREAAAKRCPECKALAVYEDEGARTCNKCGWSPSTGAD